jgi:hypothetical protein
MKRADRWVVIVAGMHRSGTSVVTKALSLLGADLPLRLMRPNKNNPNGFFEPQAIVNLHDQVLAAAGSSWSDWRKFPVSWFASEECARLKEQIIAAVECDFGNSRLALIKDPRLCRILPLWQSIFEQTNWHAYYVLPYRNPIEVVRSLAVRNGFEIHRCHLICLRHLLDVELATRRQDRVFVRYEDLLEDSHSTIKRMASNSPMPWPRDLAQALSEVDKVIRPDLRHYLAQQADLANREEVPACVQQTYNCYQSLQSDPANLEVWNRLDAIRSAFDAGAEGFAATKTEIAAPIDADYREAGEHLNGQAQAIEELRARLAAGSRESENLRRELSRSEANATALRVDVSRQSLEIERLRADLLERACEVETSQEDHSERSLEIGKLRAELADSTLALAYAKAEIELVRETFLESLSWRVTAPLRWINQKLCR